MKNLLKVLTDISQKHLKNVGICAIIVGNCIKQKDAWNSAAYFRLFRLTMNPVFSAL